MRIEACGFATGGVFTLVFVFVSDSGVTYAFYFKIIFNFSPKELSLKPAAFSRTGVRFEQGWEVRKRLFGREGRFLLSQTLLKG